MLCCLYSTFLSTGEIHYLVLCLPGMEITLPQQSPQHCAPHRQPAQPQYHTTVLPLTERCWPSTRLSPATQSQQAVGGRGLGRRQENGFKMIPGYSTLCDVLGNKSWGREEECGALVMKTSVLLIRVLRPYFPGGGQTSLLGLLLFFFPLFIFLFN